MEQKSKKIIVIAVIVLASLLILGLIWRNDKGNVTVLTGSDPETVGTTAQSPETVEIIRVHVAGYVQTPGVYDVPSDYRVVDVIELAGGAAADAYIDGLNLAAKLKDAERIYVPSLEEKDIYESTQSSPESSLVNINTASLTELKTLPGIGEARAADIISYREKNGDFLTIDAIKNVPGIGDGIFARIEDLITV